MHRHVSQSMQRLQIFGGIALGQDRGVLANGDLAAGVQSAKNSTQTKINALHVSERTLAPRLHASLEKIDTLVPGYTSGSNVGNTGAIPAHLRQKGRTLVL